MGIARNSAKLFVLRQMRKPLGLASLIVSSRLLGAEGRGLLTVLFSLPNLVLIFGGFGIGAASTWFLGKRLESERNVAATLLVAGTLLGTLWAAALFAMYSIFPESSAGTTTLQQVLVLATLPEGLLVAYVATLHIYRRQVIRSEMLTLASDVVRVAGLLALAYIVVPSLKGAELVTPLLGLLLGLKALILGIHLWRERDWLRGTPSLSLSVRMAKFGWPSALVAGAGFGLLYFDQYLLGVLRPDGRELAGVYTVATALPIALAGMSKSIASVMSRDAVEMAQADADRLIAVVARRSVLMSIAGALAALAASPLLVWVCGQAEFAPALPVIAILLLCVPLFPVSDVCALAFFARGRLLVNAAGPVTALVLNIWLNVLWIPDYGLTGAAWATVICVAVMAAIRLAIFAKAAGPRQALEVLAFQRSDLRFFSDKARAGMRMLGIGKRVA